MDKTIKTFDITTSGNYLIESIIVFYTKENSKYYFNYIIEKKFLIFFKFRRIIEVVSLNSFASDKRSLCNFKFLILKKGDKLKLSSNATVINSNLSLKKYE
jgi:hypothetical protein